MPIAAAVAVPHHVLEEFTTPDASYILLFIFGPFRILIIVLLISNWYANISYILFAGIILICFSLYHFEDTFYQTFLVELHFNTSRLFGTHISLSVKWLIRIKIFQTFLHFQPFLLTLEKILYCSAIFCHNSFLFIYLWMRWIILLSSYNRRLFRFIVLSYFIHYIHINKFFLLLIFYPQIDVLIWTNEWRTKGRE